MARQSEWFAGYVTPTKLFQISSYSLGYLPESSVGPVCPDGWSLLVRRGVDVHLGGAQDFVAQDVLDLAGIGAGLGMHQRSLRHPGAVAGPAVGLAHQVPRSSPPEVLAVALDEVGEEGVNFLLGRCDLRVDR